MKKHECYNPESNLLRHSDLRDNLNKTIIKSDFRSIKSQHVFRI